MTRPRLERPMRHRSAVLLMLLVTLLWSSAGAVSRHLDSARGFEVTFWRSAFNALALTLLLPMLRGRDYWRQALPGLRRSPSVLGSGLCWAVMYTNFMVAITLTTVATVLVTMSVAPLVTALFARVFLHHKLPLRTWVAIGIAGVGIAWMFGQQALEGGSSLTGILVALGVPLAGATNWTLLQYIHQRHQRDPSIEEPDMLPAVLIGR